MEAAKTVLRNLKNCDQYIQSFNETHRSAYFEYLISLAFAYIMHLPFFMKDNDNNSVKYRVIWQGSKDGIPSTAPEGADAIVYAYNYYILIEATMKEGKKQWSQEFARAIEHRKQFVVPGQNIEEKTHIILATTKLHNDTYCSIKTQDRFVPLELDAIHTILKTSCMAFSIKHLNILSLLRELFKILKESNSKRNYLTRTKKFILGWQNDILVSEKMTFVGVKSYEVMMKSGRNNISTSDILLQLKKNSVVSNYFNIIDDEIDMDLISASLKHQSLGWLIKTPNEDLFTPVPKEDFKGRIERIVRTVENIK